MENKESIFIDEKKYQEIKRKLNKTNDYFSLEEIEKYIVKLEW